MWDIIIIGAGPAGLSAAIYGVRSGLKVLLLEEKSYGGQIVNTPEVENYPGIKSISGFEFATALYEQAIELGAEIKYERAVGIEGQPRDYTVKTAKDSYKCKSIIIATGAKNRQLGLEDEKRLTGMGVSYCATCDGRFFTNRKVCVVGGGSTALEDALFLSQYCEQVYLIHRRDSFRGEDALAKQINEKDNVSVIYDSNVVKLNGNDMLESVVVENKNTKETITLEVSGIFIAIGHVPDNKAFESFIDLDDGGYVVAFEDCKTNAPGIFVAGDCRTKHVRQLTTAASDGAIAALGASQFVME